MNTKFKQCFSKLEDPRVNRMKKHVLMDIIALTLFAIMGGAQTFDEIELFGTIHEQWLRKYLQLPNGIPSHDTINRTLSLLDSEQLQKSFIEWITEIKGYVSDNVIAIDGKTLRGSHQNSKGLRALHVLNAYSCANGLTLGQMKVDGKTNEITVIPELLEKLALEGSIVTIDAMGCQKDIASVIVKKKANYILATKGNQKELYEPIVDVFKLKNVKPEIFSYEINSEHGRIEEREVFTLPASIIETQLDLKEWEGIQSIIKVTYIDCNTGVSDNRYFISTIDYKETERIGKSVRSHWNIENNLYWVLDVSFREDESRIRNERAALNFSWFRKMAASLLAKDESKLSVRRKMLKNWANPENIIRELQ